MKKLFLIFMISLLTMGCESWPTYNPTQRTIRQLTTNLGELEKARSSAEESISSLKDRWQGVSTIETCYERSRESYADVKAEFNSILEELKANVNEGTIPEVDKINSKVSSALVMNNIFRNTTNKCSPDQIRIRPGGFSAFVLSRFVLPRLVKEETLSLPVVAITAVVVADIVQEIIENMEENENLRREAVIKFLDGLKWESFNDID